MIARTLKGINSTPNKLIWYFLICATTQFAKPRRVKRKVTHVALHNTQRNLFFTNLIMFEHRNTFENFRQTRKEKFQTDFVVFERTKSWKNHLLVQFLPLFCCAENFLYKWRKHFQLKAKEEQVVQSHFLKLFCTFYFNCLMALVVSHSVSVQYLRKTLEKLWSLLNEPWEKKSS